ncbi:Na(+)/H(+) antiporter subunit B [Streptomyces anandii]|uniref:Na(+)/H(+) antiporter subunit B n=1 Tax=Streptomyces anandii TaxID=285454 RepID=A0ABW6HE99_9ACTN
MTVIIAVALTLVAAIGAAVVGTHSPERQAVVLSMFGMALTVLFVTVQAPDVALSQLGVGAALVPLMVMLAVRRIRRDQRGEERRPGKDGQ